MRRMLLLPRCSTFLRINETDFFPQRETFGEQFGIHGLCVNWKRMSN